MKKLITLAALFLFAAFPARAQWTNYSFAGLDVLLDIYFLDANNGFVCGYEIDASNATHNRIYRTTNGGTTWTQQFEVVDAQFSTQAHSLHAFSFTSASNGFCVGGVGGVYPFICSTTDGGQTWDSLTLPYIGIVVNIAFPGSSVGYICGEPPFANTSLFKTTDGGATWSDISAAASTAMGGCPIKDVDFITTTEGYACTMATSSTQAGIYKTTDGGTSWTQVHTVGNNEGFTSVQFISSTTGFASGTIGKVYKTTNSGATWTLIPVMTIQNDIQDVHFVNSQTGYAASTDGFNGGIYKTTNGGTSWSLDNSGSFVIMIAYYSFSFSGGKAYACGNGGYSKNNSVPQGIESTSNKVAMEVFPNPANDQVTFATGEESFVPGRTLSFRNTLGECVLVNSVSGPVTILSLSSLAPGIYFYELADERERLASGKITVK